MEEVKSAYGKIIRRTWIKKRFRQLPMNMKGFLSYLWTCPAGKGGMPIFHIPAATIASDLDVGIGAVSDWSSRLTIASDAWSLGLNIRSFVDVDRMENWEVVIDWDSIVAAIQGTIDYQYRVYQLADVQFFNAAWFIYDVAEEVIFFPKQLEYDPPMNANMVKGMFNRWREMRESALSGLFLDQLRVHAKRFGIKFDGAEGIVSHETNELGRMLKVALSQAEGFRNGLGNGLVNGLVKGLGNGFEHLNLNRLPQPMPRTAFSANAVLSLCDEEKEGTKAAGDDSDDTVDYVTKAVVEVFKCSVESARSKARWIVAIFRNRSQDLLPDEFDWLVRTHFAGAGSLQRLGSWLITLDKRDETTQVVELAQSARRSVGRST